MSGYVSLVLHLSVGLNSVKMRDPTSGKEARPGVSWAGLLRASLRKQDGRGRKKNLKAADGEIRRRKERGQNQNDLRWLADGAEQSVRRNGETN